MIPLDLKPESFAAYPDEAQTLLRSRLATLRQLPVVLLSLLLKEGIVFAWRFPIERRELEEQLSYLSRSGDEKLKGILEGFRQLPLSRELERMDWLHDPDLFVERLTAYLWASHQMDAFHRAADAYGEAWNAARTPLESRYPRLGVVVIGAGAQGTSYQAFRKLRPHGVLFPKVAADGAMEVLLSAVEERAVKHSDPYGHWYIDGGRGLTTSGKLTTVSYEDLEPARTALLNRMQKVIQSGEAGPEVMHTSLMKIRPSELGIPNAEKDPVLSYFQMTLLTEGSGTQLFSTTFAQWAAREALRRAQPATLLLRFAPRQRQRPMNELIEHPSAQPEMDPEGSLVDADMGAYYTWLNQRRLPGGEKGSFLAWFEGHGQVMAIGPGFAQGTVSASPVTMKQIVSWLS